jgi:hypothetical protein
MTVSEMHSAPVATASMASSLRTPKTRAVIPSARDRGFRRLARVQCPDSHSFIFGDEMRIADHTLTFAIITHAPGELKAALPFFSKQSLVNATRELSNMGYQVRLKKIPVTTAAAA